MTDIKQIIKQEYVKCANDPVHFMRKYCVIQHPIRGKISFDLYPFQEKTLNSLKDNDHNIILKSRQLGISTLMAGYGLWLMTFHSDKNILVVAIKQEVAKNLVTKVRVMHSNLPSWLRHKCIEDNKLSLKYSNGSQIKAVSATDDAGRSEALSLLIIDEAAFITNINEIWTAAQSTLSTGGSSVVLSTPNGVGNFFHKTWIDAEDGNNSFNFINLPWHLHPERDQSWRDQQDELLGPSMAAQECDCDFITSGQNVVDGKILQWYTETFVQEPIEKRGLDNNLWIWEHPNYSKSYVVSADVGRGDGQDYSAFHVWDVKELRQVAEYKGKLSTKEFGNLLVNTATEYNDALLIVENNNVGWATIQQCIDRDYKNLFYSSRDLKYIDVSNQMTNKYRNEDKQMVAGFSTTLKTRPLIVDKMDEYFRSKDVTVRSKRLIDELFTFIYDNGKAQAMQGAHDDLVMSLCIGLWVRDTALRLNTERLDRQKGMMGNIGTSEILYSSDDAENDTWKWSPDGKNEENLNWLLDK